MTAIILLNWNGFQDTIACLDSLFACTKQDFVWVVVDNGSENDSVRQITAHLSARGKDFFVVAEGEKPVRTLKAGQGAVYTLKENYGFAQGNNKGIALVEELTANTPKPDYYLLLNNDTLVEPDFLEKLESFAQKNPQYAALTPQIRYAEPRNLVWNCGGKLIFGLRKYLYGDQDFCRIRQKHFININLITGCALFAKRELLGRPDAWLRQKSKRYAQTPLSPTDTTDLLTNRFFFGEEDFDFSLRMQEEGKKMACVLDSVIYHKLGATRENFSKRELIYIHYLNRFIDIRQHWGNSFRFLVWQFLYIPYIVSIFYRTKSGFLSSIKLSFRMARHAKTLDAVSKETFCLISDK